MFTINMTEKFYKIKKCGITQIAVFCYYNATMIFKHDHMVRY